MIERIIRASTSRPALTIILAVAGTIFGAMWLQNLRRDVFPDLSAPGVQRHRPERGDGRRGAGNGHRDSSGGRARGLPDVRRIRSISSSACARSPSNSSRTPTTTARASSSPSGSTRSARSCHREPSRRCCPASPGRLNEIFEFTLEAEPGVGGSDDAPRPGGIRRAEPAARGPRRRGRRAAWRLSAQFQVQLDPERMAARRVSLDEVIHAVETSNVNAVGRLCAAGPDGMVRARAGSRRRASTISARPSSSCAARHRCCSATSPTSARRRRCDAAWPTG